MINNDYEGSREEFLRMLAEQGEEPAFVTRRRRLDGALEQLRWSIRAHRNTLLHGPRLHLKMLAAAVGGDWSKLSRHLTAPDQCRLFDSLFAEVHAGHPLPDAAAASNWMVRVGATLGELRASVDRFNREWRRYLGKLDLSDVNEAIDGYNQHYVLEKACAFGREDLAARGFEPYSRLSPDSLLAEFPVLELPAFK